MKGRGSIVLIGLCFSLTGCVGLSGGPIAKYNRPTGSFGDRYGSGFTAGAQGEFTFTMFSLYADAAWTRFSGDQFQGQSYESISGFELAGGARFLLGPVFVGAQFGRATGDFDQNVFRPEAGIRLGPFSVFAQHQTNKRKWWSIGGGYSFF